jgi:hypothetical protein
MRAWNVWIFPLLLAVQPLVHGQATRFDIATFTPPAGWTSAQQGDHLTYTLIDQKAGTYCMFVVYGSQATLGEPSADFASEWKALDGQVFQDIPREGLDGFDRRASKADNRQLPYWGTCTWDGAGGSIVRPGVRNPWVLRARAANQITIDGDVYTRCLEVDGLRLQGSWTTYADPGDPALDRLEKGKRPLLTLTGDGRFVDEGIFASFFDTYGGVDPSQSLAGGGTYEIGRWTLELHYADGRTRKLAITGAFGGSPAPSAGIICLGRSRFNLRK